VLLVPYAIARVFVLDSNSALCGSNWKRRPLIADVKSLQELPSEKSVSDGHLCSWRKIARYHSKPQTATFECSVIDENAIVSPTKERFSILHGTSDHSVVSNLLQVKPQTVLHSHMILLTLMLLFVLIPSTSAQEAPEVQVGSGRPSRFGDLLREHNIDLTEPALVRALKNRDSDVRFLAAMKLAEDKAVDAIPAVRRAMAAERTPRTRVNIAVALGLLGDPSGRDELIELCADGDFPPEFRLYAVRYMFDLGVERDEDCLHAAEELVQTVDSENRTVADRDSALELLPRFRNLTADESKKIFELVVDRLHDPEPTVRMAASQSLASLGNAAAIPYLEDAIAREQEEGTRSVFEANLKKLQTKGMNEKECKELCNGFRSRVPGKSSATRRE
jgi:hypothetical protein